MNSLDINDGLAWLLGLLDEAIELDAAMSEQLNVLERCLEPLAHDAETMPPPPMLVESAIARIRATIVADARRDMVSD
ncbi:MAG TPA: hypothetical protein VG713_02970 [Pirellulales bacterium]|nr:hypothetical protein [Pirellulales bacterium]